MYVRTWKFSCVALGLSVLFSGCLGPSTFGKRSAPFPAPENSVHVTRLYLDKVGDIYPDTTILLHDRDLRIHDHQLKLYFSSEIGAAQWRNVTELYRLPSDVPFDTGWDTLQAHLRQQYAIRIEEVSGVGHPLFVLVHGFNAADAQKSYEPLRAEVIRREPNATFLEVYWDGWSFLPGVGIWGEGQHNSYLAGLGLRRVLNRIDEETPVRIITHSLGGAVATAALWNIESRLDLKPTLEKWRREYFEMRNDTLRRRTPSLRNVRLGMIVPATTGNTFTDYPLRTPPENRSKIDRVIIGINPLDFPVTKAGLGCQWRGYSCLGSSATVFHEWVAHELNRDGTQVAYCIDFSRSSRNRDIFWPFFWREDHDWKSYLRRDAFPEFLAALLNPDVPPLIHACGQ